MLTVEEFAIYWNISKTTVYNLIKKGLPSIKKTGVGRRILKDQADQWLLSPKSNVPAKHRIKPCNQPK